MLAQQWFTLIRLKELNFKEIYGGQIHEAAALKQWNAKTLDITWILRFQRILTKKKA